MIKPAVFIRCTGKVFFIAAEKIEDGGKNVKREISFGREEGFVEVELETIDLLWMYACFPQQGSAVKEKLRFIYFSPGIIQTGTGMKGISLFVRGEGNGLVKKLFAKEVDNIRQPWINIRAI
jgi:hypothetical protein